MVACAVSPGCGPCAGRPHGGRSDIAERVRNTGGPIPQITAVRAQGANRAVACPVLNTAPAAMPQSLSFCLALAQPAEHGLSQQALEIARPFGFPITNSMIVTWIVAAGLIVFAQIATRKMAEVPGGAQNPVSYTHLTLPTILLV